MAEQARPSWIAGRQLVTTVGSIRERYQDNHPGDVMFGHEDVECLLTEIDRLRAQKAAAEALLPRWEAETDEQTRARAFGIAEGLRVARRDLYTALSEASDE